MFLIRYTVVFAVMWVGTVSWAQTLKPMTPDQAQQKLEEMTPAIENVVMAAPETYSFVDDKGEISVHYIGQTFRQVLINDSKLVAYKILRGSFKGRKKEARDVLTSIYEFKRDQKYKSPLAVNGSADHLVGAKGEDGRPLDIFESPLYSDVYAKGTSLKQKLAGIDNPEIVTSILGWKSGLLGGKSVDLNSDKKITPDEFVRAMVAAIGANAGSSKKSYVMGNGSLKGEVIVNAAITKDGLDLAQLLQKFFTGAVSFSQATSDYLSADLGKGKGLLGDNSKKFQADDGSIRPFTVLEHHWDEAFGYFGAARDYGFYESQSIGKGFSRDSYVENLDAGKGPYGHIPMVYQGSEDGDGEISLLYEKNFGISVNAGKRDSGSAGVSDFARTLNSYFLEGRQLITEKPEGYLEYVQAYSILISIQWEKVMAATVIHYINALQKDYEKYGTKGYKFSSLAKHFSEMKGFALAFQFSPHTPFSQKEFIEFHQVLRDKPVLPRGASLSAFNKKYIKNLDKARNILAEAYDFNSENGYSDAVLRGW